ncbi:MAG TPA: hypothetical protein VFU84_06455 [Gaiellaceae bacterium]|nr:hypothetical protein [Gaiellaceae bacterium]
MKRIEFRDALLPANADDLVASVERVLNQVVTELPRRADDAHPHPTLTLACGLNARHCRRRRSPEPVGQPDLRGVRDGE